MWYFSWILGIGLACAFSILNAMWFELRQDGPNGASRTRSPQGRRAPAAGRAMSDEALVRRYAGRAVPRYTSYPTAAEFTAAVGPQDHARWLGRLDPAEPISLYVHVPYCRALCHYCGCHAKMAIREDVFAAYRHRIETEIELVSRHLRAGSRSPPALGRRHADHPRRRGARLDRRDARPPLRLRGGLRARDRTRSARLDRPLAESLAALGINRASFGVQDLDPFVQKAIGRVQPLPVVTRGIDHLHAVGINRINLDLMYGLPVRPRIRSRRPARR